MVLEHGIAVERVLGELHEQPLVAVQIGLRGLAAYLEFFPDFIVEVLEQLATGVGHRLVDFQAQFELEVVEGGLDFILLAAALVDGGDALFEVDAGLDGAQHFVAGAEHVFEELEFFGQ